MEILRNENNEYKHWLEKNDSYAPLIISEVAKLRSQASNSTLTPDNKDEIKSPSNGIRSFRAHFGSAKIDEATGLVFGLQGTYPDRRAKVLVRLPEQPPAEEDIGAGKQWSFTTKGKNYSATVLEVSFVGDYVDLEIREVD
ncbi:hypothetical protein [Pseudomonas nitroreducens]|uniref:hypothetical protein n=1 Tax=Pseudomonas nitroreducens TaxID=46680 RepID=UPI00147F51B6|nr:hypothetical protein [Pseudomonas nitroreducens]NNN27056.1 hypothetical protein [Pseudomonas nitroreducens]